MKCSDHKNCIEKSQKKVQKLSKNNALNLTQLRQQVLQIILSSHAPLKAYDILEKLKNSKFSNTPPTVYRALDFLLENKLVHKINSSNAYVGCNHVSKFEECYFTICKKCGTTEEHNSHVINQAIRGCVRNAHVAHVNLEVEIECRDCA